MIPQLLRYHSLYVRDCPQIHLIGLEDLLGMLPDLCKLKGEIFDSSRVLQNPKSYIYLPNIKLFLWTVHYNSLDNALAWLIVIF